MKIGVIKETKTPNDARVAITPALCEEVIKLGFELVIQRSDVRCIADQAYADAGATLVEDVSDCDILVGVKEVEKEALIEGKTYFFFSHTHKEQVYNRSLLQTFLKKKIRMIDYEVLKGSNGARLIAFGKFAGMVGAHNALWTYNQRHPSFELDRMHRYEDYQEAKEAYKKIQFPVVKIVLTGTGRVATGAASVLSDMGIRRVSTQDFLSEQFDEIVFTQLSCEDYVTKSDGTGFNKQDFYTHPASYKATFKPYTEVADIMINGIFWDNDAPVFFTKEDMKKPNFKIKTIADVTCDIAPVSSIPSTLYPSTISVPVFTYSCEEEEAKAAFSIEGVDMMTIDNLPNEMPKDASSEFGAVFVKTILPELLIEKSDILDGATICRGGKLTKEYSYLQEFVDGE